MHCNVVKKTYCSKPFLHPPLLGGGRLQMIRGGSNGGSTVLDAAFSAFSAKLTRCDVSLGATNLCGGRFCQAPT